MVKSLRKNIFFLVFLIISTICLPSFVYAYQPIEFYQFSLDKGQNNISIPLIPTDARAKIVFPQTEITDIAVYNPALQELASIKYNSEWENPDYCIQLGECYFLITNKSATISVYGVRAQFPVSVLVRTRVGEARKDFFGYPLLEEMPWSSVPLYNLNVSAISEFDSQTQNYIYYSKGKFLGDNSSYERNINSLILKPGKGYGIYTWQPGAIVFTPQKP